MVKPIRDPDVEKLIATVPQIIQRNNPQELLLLIGELNNALLAKSDENFENLQLLKSAQQKVEELQDKLDKLEKS